LNISLKRALSHDHDIDLVCHQPGSSKKYVNALRLFEATNEQRHRGTSLRPLTWLAELLVRNEVGNHMHAIGWETAFDQYLNAVLAGHNERVDKVVHTTSAREQRFDCGYGTGRP
jgi:hypothetical protein